MDQEHHHHHQKYLLGRHEPPFAGEELQQLLIIRPGAVFTVYEQEFSTRYNVLKAYDSPLPIETYLEKNARSTEAVLCSGKSPITAELLRHLPSLKLVVTEGTGVNHIDLAACRRRGVAVANTADVFSEDTADYAVGLLIHVVRKISGGDGFVRRGLWPVSGEYCPLGFTLRNKRVGIIGLGNIGSKVAKRLQTFGCIISYNSRNKKPSSPYTFYPTAAELAYHSDILVVACSLTAQTRHMVDDDVMAALGSNGIIVNVGRGPIIDEKALVKRLTEGSVGGAGLDVFEYEPFVPAELFGLVNVVLSPHRGAFTEEAFSNAFETVTANLEAFFSNMPLISPVTGDE